MKLTGDFSRDPKSSVTQIIAACLLLQMLLVQPLWWYSNRMFPALPIAFWIDGIVASWATVVLPTVFGLLLFLCLIFPRKQIVLLATLGVGFVLVFLDINRLQIWYYQWMTMLAIISLPLKWSDQKMMLQFILIALYIWSGLNKLNVHYFDHSFPWLMEAFTFTKNVGNNKGLAILTALLEMTIGIGFCFPKTRKTAIFVSLTLHLIILLILGPLGHNWNTVVWPWNIAMIALVILLFGKDVFPGIKRMLTSGWSARLLFLFWGLLPGLNIIDRWDEQLSFKMYSGAYSEGILFGPAIDSECFPKVVDFYYHRTSNGVSEKRFLIDDWALAEMKVPPYVSERTLKQIARQWCSCIGDLENSGLEILRVHRWSRAEQPLDRVYCKELLDE